MSVLVNPLFQSIFTALFFGFHPKNTNVSPMILHPSLCYLRLSHSHRLNPLNNELAPPPFVIQRLGSITHRMRRNSTSMHGQQSTKPMIEISELKYLALFWKSHLVILTKTWLNQSVPTVQCSFWFLFALRRLTHMHSQWCGRIYREFYYFLISLVAPNPVLFAFMLLLILSIRNQYFQTFLIAPPPTSLKRIPICF